MLSPTEKILLQELLSRAPVPEQTLTYDELMGFMFGLAITPVQIPADEWMVAVFGDDASGISALDQARSMGSILNQVFATFMAARDRGELHFPYQLDTLQESDIEEVLSWVFGFEEALGLRPEIWEPEEEIDGSPTDELYFSLMVIQGLVDPEETMPFFDKLPDEILAQAFITFDPAEKDRQLQIRAFLLATLPLAVKTLQDHAAAVTATLPAGKRASFAAALTPPNFPTPAPPAAKPKGKVIKVDFGNSRTTGKTAAKKVIYQLKISLQGARPPIWRRVQVPGSITLDELHEVIQHCMGWMDSHLHQFRIGDFLYGPDLDDGWDDIPVRREESYTLHSLADSLAPALYYTYDFGDDWQHKIVVEKTLAASEGKPYPVLVKGKRACPPEDVGGIWGYQQFLEAYQDPEHEEYETMREWAGADFDPEQFGKEDIEAINRELKDFFG